MIAVWAPARVSDSSVAARRAGRSSSVPHLGQPRGGVGARGLFFPWGSPALRGFRRRPRLVIDQVPRRLQLAPQCVVRPSVRFGVELRWGGHKPPKDDEGSRVDRRLLDQICHHDDPTPLIQENSALRTAQGWEGARSKVAGGGVGGTVSESQAPTQGVCEAPTRSRLLDRADAMPDRPLDRCSLCVPAEPRQDQLVRAHDCVLMRCPAKRELDDQGERTKNNHGTDERLRRLDGRNPPRREPGEEHSQPARLIDDRTLGGERCSQSGRIRSHLESHTFRRGVPWCRPDFPARHGDSTP